MAIPVSLEFLRSFSEQQLRDFRGSLSGDLAAAKKSGRPGKYTRAFCTERIAAIDEVLASRGVAVKDEEEEPT